MGGQHQNVGLAMAVVLCQETSFSVSSALFKAGTSRDPGEQINEK